MASAPTVARPSYFIRFWRNRGMRNNACSPPPERIIFVMNAFDFVLIGMAAVAAGAINALAGGGTLITFPMLIAVGVPAVAANVTNTVALCPGYLGGTYAQ